MPDSEVKDDYLSAIKEIKNKSFNESIEKFINDLNTETHEDDDSRKVCIAIFEYLYKEYGITLKHRRDFGGALYI